MTAVDTNILVYAHRADAPLHLAATEAVAELAESGRPWAIPWPCIHEFLAIVTHPKIYRPATALEVALDAVKAWRESPGLHCLGEGAGHWAELARLARAGQIAGPKVHDARIAAICGQHGVTELWSVDRDFSRFPGFRVRNPLT